MRRKTPWLSLSLLLLGHGQAAAQSQPPLTDTLDMRLPAISAAYFPAPLAVGVNPAGIALAEGYDFAVLHQQNLLAEPGEESRPTQAGAEGVFLRSKWFGFGLQWVRPLEQQDSFDYVKYTFALPLVRMGNTLGVGVAAEVLDPTNTSASSSVDFSAGLLWRPLRWVSLGVVGRNLGRASIAGVQSPRLLDLALAVRPLWFAPERLTLAVDWRQRQDAADPPLRFTAWFEPVEGIGVFGQADLDGNFGAGLGIDFSRVAASVFMAADNTSSGIDASHVLVGASFSSNLKPSVLAAGGRTAVFELDAGLRRYGPPTGRFFSRRLAGWDVELGLARAVEDERIDSVLIKVQDPELSWSFVEDLRRQIERLRRAGKRVFVYLRDADNLRYYLGCAADKLLLNPGGGFSVTGPVVEALFLGGALQMIGARAEYRRVGKYKSAVETLTREQPSEPSREVLESLADELVGEFEKAVARGRSMDRQKVHELLDRGLMTPQEAKKAGLVDELVREDGLEKFLEKQLGHSVSFERRYIAQHLRDERWGRRPRIAVVHASGSIGYRAGLLGGMDAHRLADVLDWLYRTDRVDGVVLRVDSPGGSGAASDLIWHKLERLKERKPVVVSMGDVAASGGYYISAPADRIFAEPSTMTGSIGVFALFLDLSDLYASLGISKEIIKRHKLADLATTFRGRTEEELELVQRNVDAFYKRFIEIVAKGRNTTPDKIDRIGRGRVWTGRQAMERGLVDEMGGLWDAVEEVKKRLGLAAEESVELLHLPKPRLSIAGFLKDIGVLSNAADDLLELLDRQQIQLLQLAAFGRVVPAAVIPALIRIR